MHPQNDKEVAFGDRLTNQSQIHHVFRNSRPYPTIFDKVCAALIN